MKNCSQLILRGGSDEWELRIFINSKLEKLEKMEFKLYVNKNTGAPTLLPDERAYQVGSRASIDDFEALRELAFQVGKKEAITEIKCPEQLRKGNERDFSQFERYCDELKPYLAFHYNLHDSFFAYTAKEANVSTSLITLINKYLPMLRVMTIQKDEGKQFLVAGNIKVEVFLTKCLSIIAQREREIFASTGLQETKSPDISDVIDKTLNKVEKAVDQGTKGSMIVKKLMKTAAMIFGGLS